MLDFCPLFHTQILVACNKVFILPVARDTFVISVADRHIFLCLVRQRGAGASSVRLGRHHYGCLHSAGSAALEELHLPATTDREYNRRPSSPRGRRWGRETHWLRARQREVMSFPAKEKSLLVGRRCFEATFSPAIAQWPSCSDSRPLSIMQIDFDSRVIAQWRLCAPGVCFPHTIWPFGHQAGAAAQSDNQGCSTIRPIIDNNRVQFRYSDSDFGLYPLSARLPRGLRPRQAV